MTGIGEKRTHKSQLFFLFLVLGTLCITLSFFFRNKSSSVISPVVKEESSPKTLTSLFRKAKNPTDLEAKIKETIGTSWNNYSVYVRDFSSDFSAGIDENVIFTAASVNKIPILAVLYSDVQQKKTDLDTIVTLQQDDIQDYGTGSMRYDGAGTTYSIKTLAKLMMQKSDNTAAYLLGNTIVGMDNIQAQIDAWGLTQTDMVNNKTSNADMAILMKRIYEGNVANQALTKEMLAFFKDSDFENRLPALLPTDVSVYHKTGNGVGEIHDVGVIVSPTTTYYIGVLTSDVTDEDAAVKLIAQISKVVYDFMK